MMQQLVRKNDQTQRAGHNYELIQVSHDGIAVVGDVSGNFNVYIEHHHHAAGRKQVPRKRRICFRDREKKPRNAAHNGKPEYRNTMDELHRAFERLTITDDHDGRQSLSSAIREFGARTYGVDVPIDLASNTREILSSSHKMFENISRGTTSTPATISDPDHLHMTGEFMDCIIACIACAGMYSTADGDRHHTLDVLRDSVDDAAVLLEADCFVAARDKTNEVIHDFDIVFSIPCSDTLLLVLELLPRLVRLELQQHFLPLMRAACRSSVRMLGQHHPLHRLLKLFFSAIENGMLLSFPWEQLPHVYAKAMKTKEQVDVELISARTTDLVRYGVYALTAAGAHERSLSLSQTLLDLSSDNPYNLQQARSFVRHVLTMSLKIAMMASEGSSESSGAHLDLGYLANHGQNSHDLFSFKTEHFTHDESFKVGQQFFNTVATISDVMEGHRGLSNPSALSTQLTEHEQAAVDKEIAHFRPLSLALPTIEDPDFRPIYQSRTITHGGRGHTLMADTWNTPTTITHLLSYARYKTDSLPAEVRRFYTFGNGLNAHPGLLHGGVVSCILDSSMGGMAGIAVIDKPRLEGRETTFTVQLNVKFEKPITTPGTVMVKAWVKSVDAAGRKIWIGGQIVSGEKGEITHARAEGLWLRVVAKL